MSILNGKETMLIGLKGDSCFIRYSRYASGADFTEVWQSGQNYIGFATAQVAPADRTEYKWFYFGDRAASGNGSGADGIGIESIEMTETSGLVDIYTIYYTDGTTSTFTVTNGKDGEDGSTPVKGVDYWTDADKAEIVNEVLSNFIDASEVAM